MTPAADPGARPTAILWLDLEMTGLDFHLDAILEVGAVLTDSDLNELGRFQTLVRPPEDLIARLEAEPKVLDMHTQSGLLHELLTSRRDEIPTVDDVDRYLMDFADAYAPDHDVVLGGSGVERYDRQVIAAQMPAMHARLPYWCLDVSTVRRGYHVATHEHLVPAQAVAHRVIADIEDALRVARVAWPMFRAHAEQDPFTDRYSTPVDRVLAGLGLIDAFREHEVVSTSEGDMHRGDTAEAMRALISTANLDSVAGLMDAGTLLLETAAEATGLTPGEVVARLRRQVLSESV